MSEGYPAAATPAPEAPLHEMQVQEVTPYATNVSGEHYSATGVNNASEIGHGGVTNIGTRHGESATTEYRDQRSVTSRGPASLRAQVERGFGETEYSDHMTTDTTFNDGSRMVSRVTSREAEDHETGKVTNQVRASRERITVDPVTGEEHVRPIRVNEERMARAAGRLANIYANERAAQAEAAQEQRPAA